MYTSLGPIILRTVLSCEDSSKENVMPEHVTILDVAREAGVSFKTVSNVLNNTGSMKESTRRRVEKAIDKLGYVVNASALLSP